MKHHFYIHWFKYLLSFCLVALSLMGSYGFLTHYVFARKPVNIFLEMKVLDEEGHPIAGAYIINVQTVARN